MDQTKRTQTHIKTPSKHTKRHATERIDLPTFGFQFLPHVLHFEARWHAGNDLLIGRHEAHGEGQLMFTKEFHLGRPLVGGFTGQTNVFCASPCGFQPVWAKKKQKFEALLVVKRKFSMAETAKNNKKP